MKIVRFQYKQKEHWGILKEDANINVLKKAPYAGIKKTSQNIPLKKVKLLAPATPTKIVLVGLNYRKHAKELKMQIPRQPIIFLKAPTSLNNPNGLIRYPASSKRVDFEAELALVIKKKAKNIKAKDVMKYILGFTCLNDVTARDLQNKDGQWTRAKSFDSFCPVGPHIETKVNTADLRVRAYLNGNLMQDSSIKDFIFPIDQLISFISKMMTLLPGDIVSTGTPSGVGPMRKNDIIEVEIENIGRLKNKVV
jgi:2-keto-4-pentenoate hydratase/2-oxohepta-3-ene-1,7-dioic acid hydratase in catechol pathway